MCMVYVGEYVYECERVSRLCAWCMWVNMCMNVREFIGRVHGVCV